MPETRAQPLLEIDDLAVTFRQRGTPPVRAVDGVSLSVHAGQTIAVVGESGCGKSVTAMSVLRLIPTPPGEYTRGRILYRGGEREVDLLTLDQKRLRQIRGGDIAMIFQEPMTSLNPVFSIGEQLVETIRLHQRVGKKEAEAIGVRAMEEVGIPDPASRLRSYPHEFSGGMRQRAMIAMALACEPSVLIADEPTTALDVTVQKQVLDLIDGLRREHDLGVVLISHDLGVVAERADVVCVVYAGRVVEYARARELFSNPLHPYTKGLLACVPRLHDRRERLQTVRAVVEDPANFTALGPDRTPWWPWMSPPEGALDDPPSVLEEVAPEHWVGVWRRSASREGVRPDLPPVAQAAKL